MYYFFFFVVVVLPVMVNKDEYKLLREFSYIFVSLSV